MFRLPLLRSGAAVFVLSAASLAAPASAQTVPAAKASVASYAAVLRTINPKLPLEKARAYARSVMANAWRTRLDPRFIMSIVTVESRWRSNALSRAGARGLGQLMPATAASLRVNAWNASDNLRGTSRYLKSLMDRFAGKPNAVKLAIAGYNAGPKAVERYHGVPPYSETRNYVVRVLRVWKQLNTRVGKTVRPSELDATFAVSKHALPDERQWLSNVNEILPATAAAVESLASPIPAPEAAAEATIATPQPAQPGK